MDQFTNHFDVVTGDSSGSGRTTARGLMKPVIEVLIKLGGLSLCLRRFN
jgi:NADP-dependent 3-hydroxy acid dehydrogenase YdfG